MKTRDLGHPCKAIDVPPDTPLQILLGEVLLNTTLTCPIYLRRDDDRILGSRVNTTETLAKVVCVRWVDPGSAPRVSARIVQKSGMVEVWDSSPIAYYRVSSVKLYPKGLVITLTGNLVLKSDLSEEEKDWWEDTVKQFNSKRCLRASVTL